MQHVKYNRKVKKEITPIMYLQLIPYIKKPIQLGQRYRDNLFCGILLEVTPELVVMKRYERKRGQYWGTYTIKLEDICYFIVDDIEFDKVMLESYLQYEVEDKIAAEEKVQR